MTENTYQPDNRIINVVEFFKTVEPLYLSVGRDFAEDFKCRGIWQPTVFIAIPFIYDEVIHSCRYDFGKDDITGLQVFVDGVGHYVPLRGQDDYSDQAM